MNKTKCLSIFVSGTLIILVVIMVFNFQNIILKLNFSKYYGKYLNQNAYNFKLKDTSHAPISLKDYRGKILFLTFGFSNCNGICPLNMHRFKLLSKKINQMQIKNVSFAFVSIDPIRDQDLQLKHFVTSFDIHNLKGLISGEDQVLDVARKYYNYISYDKIKLEKDPTFQINHNGFIYLINPTGQLSLIYMQKELKIEKVVADIKKINMENI